MAWKKFKADKLFDGFQFSGTDKVLITDEEGTIQDLLPAVDAGDDIQHFNGILSPGLINCHCHLELSHMRSHLAERTGLVKFLVDVVQQRNFPEEKILQSITDAEDEMLSNGIVAVGDICNNTFTLTQKMKGRLFYHNFIEASGYNPHVAEKRFERSVGFFREYAKYYSIPIESNSITPHAPYSVGDQLWEYIIRFPGNHLLTIHNQETAGENEWFISKSGELEELYQKLDIDTAFFKPPGISSLQTYLPKFLKNQSVILVHNIHTSENDLVFAASKEVNCRTYWCLCPNANQYISAQLPPVELLMKHECQIVLGTDSLASNHQLNLLDEVNTLRKAFPGISLETYLRWATSNGAKALQMDALLGSFDQGKRPGVVLIESDLSSCRRLT